MYLLIECLGCEFVEDWTLMLLLDVLAEAASEINIAGLSPTYFKILRLRITFSGYE